ncbi:hypothetical protein GWI33_016084 [Rhynchophorus ferrugineus]|uniref:BAG domain-containing protein n=1 Tax=Rhynchophorus ferrugineus TaxID=354439 RepID=A0A834IBW1_RHYFE|nr:hypothetical protein GWI33_016084 [Rhynchophorus ferrugineus]
MAFRNCCGNILKYFGWNKEEKTDPRHISDREYLTVNSQTPLMNSSCGVYMEQLPEKTLGNVEQSGKHHELTEIVVEENSLRTGSKSNVGEYTENNTDKGLRPVQEQSVTSVIISNTVKEETNTSISLPIKKPDIVTPAIQNQMDKLELKNDGEKNSVDLKPESDNLSKRTMDEDNEYHNIPEVRNKRTKSNEPQPKIISTSSCNVSDQYEDPKGKNPDGLESNKMPEYINQQSLHVVNGNLGPTNASLNMQLEKTETKPSEFTDTVKEQNLSESSINILEELESRFENINEEVNIAWNTDEIKKCNKLSQKIRRLLNELKKNSFKNDSNLNDRKNRLIGDMSMLIKSIEIVNYFIELQNNLTPIEELLLKTENYKDLNNLYDELQVIRNKFNEYQVSDVAIDNIRQRKAKGQQKTEELIQKLISIKHRLNTKEIDEIQEKVETLKSDIHLFVGIKLSNRFYELDETIIRLILSLDKLEITDESLRNRKKHLLKELHKLADMLDDYAQKTEKLLSSDKELQKVFERLKSPDVSEKIIESSNNSIEKIAEEIRQLMKTNENVNLIERCKNSETECQRIKCLIDKLENDLNARKLSSNVLITNSPTSSEHIKQDHIENSTSDIPPELPKTNREYERLE